LFVTYLINFRLSLKTKNFIGIQTRKEIETTRLDCKMDNSFTSLNPPAKKGSSQVQGQGKQLLNLLKSLERSSKHEGKDNNISAIDEINNMLADMQASYERQGLFGNDLSRAKSHPSTSSSAAGIPISLPSNKKRKRGGNNSTGKIASLLNIDGGNSTEESYAISNLCRILISGQSIDNSNSDNVGENGRLAYPPSVIANAAMALNAICEFCKDNLPSETAFLEQDMISSISSQLLNGVSKTMNSLLRKDGMNLVLIACCQCAANVIILSNVRLSRSGKTMESIRNVAREVILYESGESLDMNGLVEASAELAAAIPLTSNSESASPSKLWTNMVLEHASELSSALKAFFPLVKKLKRGTSGVSNKVDWIDKVRNATTSQADRLVIFFARIKGSVAILNSLMKMNGYHFSNEGCGVAIPVTSLLEACEQMLLFATIAETRYLATKSKLRDVSIEGGLLSPNAALATANAVKYLGYTLFDSVTSALTTTSLQYGQQIIRIALTSLQSSSSLALRTVIDPTSCVDKNSKRKWLHSLVKLRTMSVNSFSTVARIVGSNAAVTQKDLVTKAIAFISGCLLEQISGEDGKNPEENESWGTISEKAKLVSTCADTLGTFLSVFGGFMAMQNRELIESIASSCLSQISVSGKAVSNIATFAEVKSSFLRLGISCINNPWPDGGASTLVRTVRQIAFALKFDRDASVSSTAYLALSSCNMVQTSRSPPLVIVTRFKEGDMKVNSINTDQFFSMEGLKEGMSIVKEDILKSKIIEKTKDENKKRVREEKEAKNSYKKSKKTKEVDDKPKIETTDQVTKEKQTVDSSQKLHTLQGEKEDGSKADATSEHDQLSKDPQDKLSSRADEVDVEMTEENDGVIESPSKDLNGNNSKAEGSGDDDDEFNFPPIIDCGPDDEDI